MFRDLETHCLSVVYTNRSQTLHCASKGSAVKYLIRGQKCLSDKCMNVLVECSIILTTVLPHGYSLSSVFFFFSGLPYQGHPFWCVPLHVQEATPNQSNRDWWIWNWWQIFMSTGTYSGDEGNRKMRIERKKSWRERDSEVETASRRERRGVRMHW